MAQVPGEGRLYMENGKKGWKKTVSGCDRASNLDFENSLHHLVILIADFCHYQKFNI